MAAYCSTWSKACNKGLAERRDESSRFRAGKCGLEEYARGQSGGSRHVTRNCHGELRQSEVNPKFRGPEESLPASEFSRHFTRDTIGSNRLSLVVAGDFNPRRSW